MNVLLLVLYSVFCLEWEWNEWEKPIKSVCMFLIEDFCMNKICDAIYALSVPLFAFHIISVCIDIVNDTIYRTYRYVYRYIDVMVRCLECVCVCLCVVYISYKKIGLDWKYKTRSMPVNQRSLVSRTNIEFVCLVLVANSRTERLFPARSKNLK